MDDIDLDIKRKYIYENITKISNHRNYLDIVNFHGCPHTNNSNGIFLNLNTIEVEVIDKLYYKLRNEIEDDDFNINISEKQVIEKEIEGLLKENKKKETKGIFDIITIDQFTEKEKYIITQSKKYKI
tara:strand:- start:8972 stop:9352 length:381 start_codon:yes stop_codon:yes gene_type:complete